MLSTNLIYWEMRYLGVIFSTQIVSISMFVNLPGIPFLFVLFSFFHPFKDPPQDELESPNLKFVAIFNSSLSDYQTYGHLKHTREYRLRRFNHF